MISEYAFGHYALVLSLMFLSWGIGSWALVVAIWSQVHTNSGKVGLWFLSIAGTGEAMASVFDITHPIGHGIAGVLGVIGFPIAALLLSVALGRNQTWRHPDFEYQPLFPPEELGDAGRVRWVSGTPGKPPAYAGTDFIVARNGRIASVYLFFDNLP
jgi:hypothetical protein